MNWIGRVSEAALLDHVDDAVELLVELVEDAAHQTRQNIGGGGVVEVEMGRAEADRVDDVGQHSSHAPNSPSNMRSISPPW